MKDSRTHPRPSVGRNSSISIATHPFQLTSGHRSRLLSASRHLFASTLIPPFQTRLAGIWPLTALWVSSITLSLANAKCRVEDSRVWVDYILACYQSGTFSSNQVLPVEGDMNAITSCRLTCCFCKDTPFFSVSRGQYSEANTYHSLVIQAVSTIAAIYAGIRINQSRTLMTFSVCGAVVGAVLSGNFLPVTMNELWFFIVSLSSSMGATTGVVWTALLPKSDD